MFSYFNTSKHLKIKKPAKSEWEEEEGEEEQEEEQEEELLEEQKDEFFAQVPNDVVERLVIRPEDTLPRVEESIKTYKQALLSVLEVFPVIYIFYETK